MPISFDPAKRLFRLDTKTSTYAFFVYRENYLVHLYYGAKVPDSDLEYLMYRGKFDSLSPWNTKVDDPDFSADITPFEYPTNGAGDMRIAALSVRNGDGNAVTDVRYVSHKITPGKPALEGLPATFADDSQARDPGGGGSGPGHRGEGVPALYRIRGLRRDHPQRAGGKRRQRACHPGAGLRRLPGPAHHGLGHGPRLRPVGQREHHRAPPPCSTASRASSPSGA